MMSLMDASRKFIRASAIEFPDTTGLSRSSTSGRSVGSFIAAPDAP